MVTDRGIGHADPYDRLGLAPGAPLPDVKRAYRRLAMDFHPDHAGPASLQSFLEVTAAYEWIVAHPWSAEPGDRRGSFVTRTTVARTAQSAPTRAARPAPPSAARSSWPGGRWYWEGMLARAARA